MLRARLQEALDIAAAGEVLALGAQHDHAHVRVGVQGLEHGAELVALGHGDHVQRRPAEDDVAPLAPCVDMDLEAVERAFQGTVYGV